MADDNNLISTTTKQDAFENTPQLSSSAQTVIGRYAEIAQDGLTLLEHFIQDKNRVGSTTQEILKFAEKKANPEQINNFTFEDLLQLLTSIEVYLEEPTSREYFEGKKRLVWTKRMQEIAFGTNPTVETTFGEVNDALKTAINLLQFVIQQSKQALPQSEGVMLASTPQSNIPNPIEPTIEEDGIPSSLFGDVKAEPKNEPVSRETNVRESEKNKSETQPHNVIQEIASGDAAFHREMVRMEVMLANQLAAFYGISDKTLPKFTQEFTQYIAPHLYFELQKLGPNAIKEALKSPKGRSNVYLSALLRMQHDPAFSARLTLFLKTTAQGKQPQKKNGRIVEPTNEEVAQTPQPLPKDIVEAIEKAGDQVVFTETELENIGQMRSTSTATLAQELRNLLGDKGAGLLHSDIDKILIRLQAYSVTRKNIHTLTQTQYQDIFGTVFGNESPLVFQRIQKAFQASNLDWTRLFSAYVESTRLDIFEKTHNPAVLFLNKDAQPSDTIVTSVQNRLFQYGPATYISLYSPKQVLEQRKQELETAGGVALESPEYKQIGFALELQNTNTAMLKRIAKLTAPQQEYFFSSLGYTQEIYQQMHLTEVFAYIQSVQIEGAEPDAQFISFIMPEEYLTASTEDGVYAPSPEGAQWLQYAQMAQQAFGAQQGGEGGYQVNQTDRMLGKLALAALTGGESIVIIDKIEKIQGFIGKLPGGEKLNELMDKYGWRSLDLIGKAIKWLFSFAALSTLVNLMAFLGTLLLGIKYASAIGSALQGLASQLATGLKSVIGKAAAFGTKLAGGIGNALSGLSASGVAGLKALIGGVPFAGGAAIAGASGIMIYQIFFSNNVGPAFLTNIDGSGTAINASYADGVGNRGCWPTSGIVTGLDKYDECTPNIFNSYCMHGVTSQCHTGLTGQNVCGVGPGGTGQAIDIAAPLGTPIYAPYPGEATYIPKNSGICFTFLNALGIRECSYGNHIMLLSHLDNKDVIFIFAHLDTPDFKANQKIIVSVGQQLGSVGTTGNSTGPHLHYEVLGTSRDSIIPEKAVFKQSLKSSCTPGSPIEL